MEIIKELDVKNFDKSLYTEKNIKDCVHGENVSVTGTIKITQKSTSAGAPYYILTIFDSTGSVNYMAWNGSPVFKLIDINDNGKAIKAYGVVDIAKYRNIDIKQLQFIEETEEEREEKETLGSKLISIENLKKELNKNVDKIVAPFFKDITLEALNIVSDKLYTTPFSEKTAYNYKGGLMHQIVDMCDMVDKVSEAINCGFYSDSTIVNEDLLFTCAIICNLGKTRTLTFENNIPVKTFEGKLEEDSIFSREIAHKAVEAVFNKINDEDKEAYEKIAQELLHIVSSVKGTPTFGALTTPRSKHAIIMSHINDLVYTKGLFENLEKAEAGTEFTKAYDNGKNYYLGSTHDE